MSSKSVIVIGGGLAGLSSAVALADAGWQVRLFEQRPFLGGRAASFVLPGGDLVDNCQHVTFECCTNLEDFYQRVGVANDIQFFDRLLLVDPQGRQGALSAGILPAPFHLAGSFVTFSLLSAKDKLGIARAMLSIVRGKGEPPELNGARDMSMLEWLHKTGQTPKAVDRFWRAVLVSALSEELDRIDARYGVQVFWKSVLTTSRGYRMGVPKVALGALYDACRKAIEAKGGVVNFRAPARGLRIEENQLKAIVFDEGREEAGDSFVIALPHGTLDGLLPEDVKKQHPELAQIGKIEDAPITGVHFWFDREVMKEPYMTLLDTTTQWIFNKTALYGQNGKGKESGQYLQLVISASHSLLQKPREEIVELCLGEVRHVLPAARDANLLKSTVIKEAAATFSPRPGVDRLRPKQATPVKGMYLAGDWTATGWPATMEGAVRSGYLAAEAILSDAGTPRRFLRPDLRPEGLMRFWAGKN